MLFSDVSALSLETIFFGNVLCHSTVVTDEHRVSCVKNRLSLMMAFKGEAETSEDSIRVGGEIKIFDSILGYFQFTIK